MEEEKKQNETSTAEAEIKPEAAKDKEKEKKEKKQYDKEQKKLRSEIDALKAELEGMKTVLAEAEDKYLRVAAEYDNFRRRSQKEREGIYADALADSVKELLPIIDNLQRASQFSEADKVTEGVQLTLRGLPEVLEKLGITAYGEPGEAFDPNIHNAVMHEENPERGENEITSVFQQGYRLGDKIIRFAMVTVAN